MARKRANKEGSVYQDADGVWWAQLPADDRGKRPKRRAKTQREALEKLRQLERDHEQGMNLSVKQPTVSQWCAIWLLTFALNLRPNIRDDYRGEIARYVDSAPLGSRRMDKVTPAEVQAWVNELAGRLSPRTVRNAHARLHKAFEVAIKHGYLARNPATGTELPQLVPAEIEPYTFQQAIAILEAVEGHRWAALYRLAINLGMREGELFGLTWEAIDLEAGTIRVFQQLRRVRTSIDGPRVFVLQTVKKKASVRTLRIDDDMRAVLRAHRANQAEERLLRGPAWRDPFGSLVFTTETGGPIFISSLLEHFYQVLAKAELPKRRFHDLRHTAATLMLANGTHLVTVSKILGHSSPAITAQIYAHALDEDKAGAIASLSQRLRRA